MKKILLIISILISLNFVNAQNIGVQIGLNSSKWVGYSNIEEYSELDYNTVKGLKIGINYNIPVSNNILAEVGMYYSQKGAKEKTDFYNLEVNTNYVDFPILIKYKYQINENISLMGVFGPSIEIGLNGKETYYDLESNDKESLDVEFVNEYNERSEHLQLVSKNFGLNIGFTTMYQNLEIIFNYNLGLTNIPAKQLEDNDGVIKQNVFSVSFGYRFNN